MEINKKNRTELKSYFLANKIPTQKNFEEFIDGGLNQAEDGLAKTQGNPIALQTEGDPSGTQETLHLYKAFADANPGWAINLNPRVDPSVSTSNKPGLNIKDAGGTSRFFIKNTGGYIGVGTIEPSSKLSIKATKDESLISATGNYAGNPKIFEVKQEANDGALYVRQGTGDIISKLSGYPAKASYFKSKVGIGITTPDANLQINGSRSELRIKNTNAGDWAFLSIRGSGANYWDMAQQGNNDTLEFRPNGGEANKLVMRHDGTLQAPGGIMANGSRANHLDVDGSFYRYAGQSYLTVDDNLYFRRSNDKTRIHFQVNTGRVHIGGENPEAPLTISGTGKISTPDGSMHIGSNCILFGGLNVGKQANSAQISAGLHEPNSLNIVGMSSGTSYTDRRVDVWAEGGMKVKGNLTTTKALFGEGSSKIEWALGYDDRAATTGKWVPSTSWGEPIIHASCAYSDTYGNVSASETLDFKIPAGAKTAYLSTLAWSSSGYYDIYLKMANVWKFHRRISNYQAVSVSASGGTHDGNVTTMAATGLDHFTQIRLQNRNGRIHFTGIGFSREDMAGTYETGFIHQDNVVFPHIIRGMVIMWHGSSAPAGWALCNGTNGTPDLRGRFVLGSGQGSGLTNRKWKQYGGFENVTLNIKQIPKHSHGVVTRQDDYNVSGGAGPSFGKDNGTYKAWHQTDSVGGSQAHTNTPPYFVLAFIMKL